MVTLVVGGGGFGIRPASETRLRDRRLFIVPVWSRQVDSLLTGETCSLPLAANACTCRQPITVVTVLDWVPEPPFSIQRIGDFNPANPFVNVRVGPEKAAAAGALVGHSRVQYDG